MDPATGCWYPAQKPQKGGYVRVRVAGQGLRPMHVLAYEHRNGPVPDGMIVDHECHNQDLSCNAGIACRHRSCCNPDHLVVATYERNYRRGRAAGFLGRRNAAKTHCPKAHPYSVENTRIRPDGGRICRTCHREAARRAGYWRRPRT